MGQNRNCPVLAMIFEKEKSPKTAVGSLPWGFVWLREKDFYISALPLANIVAPLAWSASRCSVFAHSLAFALSATGGARLVPPRHRQYAAGRCEQGGGFSKRKKLIVVLPHWGWIL